LLSERTGVIDVTAVTTAKGEHMISTAEETSTSVALDREAQPKASKKTTPAKKAPKGTKKAKSAREGSKTNQVLELLRQPGGVTAKELMKATGLAGAFRAGVPFRHRR
jgi:hypothetical protein